MLLKNFNFKIRWKSDSALELGEKLTKNYSYIRRWFGTGILRGGKPSIKYSDFTDSIQIISHYIIDKDVTRFRTNPYPAPDSTIQYYNVLTNTGYGKDTTVNAWIEGSKVEFLDGTVLGELRPYYDTTDDVDIQIPTRSILFDTPILALINNRKIYYDSTTEYVCKFNDGTSWIYLNKDRQWIETRKELDSTNYLLLWSVRFDRIKKGPEGTPYRLSEVRDLRNIIPNTLNKFRRINFKEPVSTPDDLPLAGSENGDVRITTDSYKNYIWIYDSSNINSITNTHWNPIESAKNTVAKKAFSSIKFRTQNKSDDFIQFSTTEIADSSASQIIFTEGQHITLTPNASSDRITISFIVDRNLDFNGRSYTDDRDKGPGGQGGGVTGPGGAGTNKIIHIKDIDTTNFELWGTLSVDGTTWFGNLVDVKDIFTILHSVKLLKNVGTVYLDMTVANMIIDGGIVDLGSNLIFTGNIDANFIDIYRRGNPPDNYLGDINGFDITNHHTRHETGGVDEIDFTNSKGVAKGQNAGKLQDRDISALAPQYGDVLAWSGSKWEPTPSSKTFLSYVEQIALWSDRRVPLKKINNSLAFLEKNHKFNYPGQFSSNDDKETPPGNWVPLYGSWDIIKEKEIYAKDQPRSAFLNSPYSPAYRGVCFDGRYVYACPSASEYFVRYDTHYGFDQTESWESMRVTRVQADATASKWFGCTFDGRYVYYVPYYNTSAVRFETGNKFTDTTSWEVANFENILGKNWSTLSWTGGVYDGRYIHFVPDTAKFILSYDSRKKFTDPGAWKKTQFGNGFVGGVYDGNYVYFSPSRNPHFVRFSNFGSNRTLTDSTTEDKDAVRIFADYVNDGYVNESAHVLYNNLTLGYLGQRSNEIFSCFFRIPHLTIKKFSTITSAKLKFYKNNFFGSGFKVKVFAIDQNDPSAFTDYTDFTSRPRLGVTTGKQYVSPPGGLWQTLDVKKVVQALVNKYDYNKQSMLFLVLPIDRDTASDPNDYASIAIQSSSSITRSAYLSITYGDRFGLSSIEEIDTTKVLKLDLTVPREESIGRGNKFSGATFDGSYIYYAPYDSTSFVRYNTKLAFNARSSWQLARMGSVLGRPGTWTYGWDEGGNGRFFNCRFDGRYVYYCPYNSPLFTKYDTLNGFTSAFSWDKLNLKMGTGVTYPNTYQVRIHKYVEENNPNLLGTNRILLSNLSGGSYYYFYHGIWDQENVRSFHQSYLHQINHDNPVDTTFVNSSIGCATFERTEQGNIIVLFTTENTGAQFKNMVYKINLEGNVISRRRLGNGFASGNDVTWTDTDQVYGYIYFSPNSGGVPSFDLQRLDYDAVLPTDRAITVATSGTGTGQLDLSNNGFNCFINWSNGKWHSNIIGYKDEYSYGGYWGSVLSWFIVNSDGSLTFKKHIWCDISHLNYDGLTAAGYTTFDVDKDGFVYISDTNFGFSDTAGSYFVFDTTNFDADITANGWIKPKCVRWSGPISNTPSPVPDIMVNETLRKLNDYFRYSYKINLVLDKNQEWIHTNLWSTAARHGRINTSFTYAETHSGYFQIKQLAGCEISSKDVVYLPGEGKEAVKYKKPYKLNINAKLGWRGSP